MDKKRGRPRKSASKRRENRLDTYLTDFLYSRIKQECERRGDIPHSVLVNEVLADYFEKKDNATLTA